MARVKTPKVSTSVSATVPTPSLPVEPVVVDVTKKKAAAKKSAKAEVKADVKAEPVVVPVVEAPAKKKRAPKKKEVVPEPIVEEVKAPEVVPEAVVEAEPKAKSRGRPSKKKEVVPEPIVEEVKVESDADDASDKATAGDSSPAESLSSESPDHIPKKRRREFEIVPGSIRPQNGAPSLDKIHKNGSGSYTTNAAPQSAAKKAYTSLVRAAKVKGASYVFAIREKKTSDPGRYYIGTCDLLDVPKEITRNGTTYPVKRKTVVRVWKEGGDDQE